MSGFASLVGFPIGITSSAIGLKTCAITAGIKKFKSIIRKGKKQDKIVLLAKTKLNNTGVLIYKAVNDYISLGELVLVNDLPNEYDDMKEEIKNLKTSSSN